MPSISSIKSDKENKITFSSAHPKQSCCCTRKAKISLMKFIILQHPLIIINYKSESHIYLQKRLELKNAVSVVLWKLIKELITE